jgi:hypothetical protein
MSNGVKSESKKAIICFDEGSSATKIIYQIIRGEEKEEVKYMLFPPEHIELPVESRECLPTSSGMGQEEDNAWIRFKKDGPCHAFGRVAIDYRAFVNIRTDKWKLATPKILAAIGAIALKENLGVSFNLDLGVLLPWGEISSASLLSQELKESLKGFYFRTTWLKVKIERLRCLPEGSGAAIWDSMVTNYGKNHNCLYLMFGYRDTSALFFRKGTLSKSETSTAHFGFFDLIDKMRSKIPGLEREEVLMALSTQMKQVHLEREGEYSYKDALTSINWKAIVKSNKPEAEKEEILRYHQAYNTSSNENWQLISSWLSSVLPPISQINAVVRLGGTSDLLAERLHQFFGSIPVYLPHGYGDEVMKALGLFSSQASERRYEFIRANLPMRLMDVWGLFAFFSGYPKPF